MRQGRCAVGLAALIALAVAAPAQAAPFTVTRFDDPVPDACAPGDCSLREAIRAANVAVGADTIALDAGTYQLSQIGTGEDAALDGDLDITDDLALTGAGAGATTIDGGGDVTLERVLNIDPGASTLAPVVDISALMITDGAGLGTSGVLAEEEARTTLSGVSVSGNDGPGGGVRNENDGVMTIRDSLVSGNTGTGSGMGVYNQNQATMTIERTAITGNTTTANGAGLFHQNQATLTMRDSTIDGNTSTEDRAGGVFIQNQTQTTIENSTIANNTAADGDGGGFFIQNQSVVNLTNVTLAGNKASDTGGGSTPRTTRRCRSTTSRSPPTPPTPTATATSVAGSEPR